MPHGWFECDCCDHRWYSRNIEIAIDGNGYEEQECDECGQECEATDVKDGLYWGRCFGHFECDACESEWGSAHVYRKDLLSYYTQDCLSCNIPVEPHEVKRLRHSGKQNKKNHLAHLCEKCQSGDACT